MWQRDELRIRLLVLGGFDVGEFGELVDDADGFDAYCGDAFEEVDDAFLVVGEAVGVEVFADGRVSGCALFILVEDPFEGRAAAEAVCQAESGMAVRVVWLSRVMVSWFLSAGCCLKRGLGAVWEHV